MKSVYSAVRTGSLNTEEWTLFISCYDLLCITIQAVFMSPGLVLVFVVNWKLLMMVYFYSRSGILDVVLIPKLRWQNFSETGHPSVFRIIISETSFIFCKSGDVLTQALSDVLCVYMCVSDRHMQSRKTGILIKI